MSVLVLSSSIKFRKQPTGYENTLDIILVSEEDGKYEFSTGFDFKEISEEQLTSFLDDLRDYAKREKNSVKGFVVVRNENGDFIKYSILMKEIRQEIVSVKIAISKTGKSSKPSATFEEKIDLLRNYVEEKHVIPAPGIIVKEIDLGKFAAKCENDSEKIKLYNNVKQFIDKPNISEENKGKKKSGKTKSSKTKQTIETNFDENLQNVIDKELIIVDNH